jgi:protein-tyrosine phosphatase
MTKKQNSGTPVPFPDSYWVIPGKFLAGEYPRTEDRETSLKKIQSLLASGIRHIIDLTEPGEINRSGIPLLEYRPLLETFKLPLHVTRYPIRDKGIAEKSYVKAILDEIDETMGKGTSLYLHCWGGHGRTGLVVGCWLARHGLGQSRQIFEHMRSLRNRMKDGWKDSPETEGQKKMVLDWHIGE